MQRFSYSRPPSLAEAVRTVAEGDGAVRFLGGGHHAVDRMKLGIERPAALVDVTRLPGLDDILVTERELRFGALVRMSDAAAHDATVRDYPMISESLWRAASQQLRNMAILGAI
jgi:xanthine dehydrogenase YagS FAD-binding subunit